MLKTKVRRNWEQVRDDYDSKRWENHATGHRVIVQQFNGIYTVALEDGDSETIDKAENVLPSETGYLADAYRKMVNEGEVENV